MAGPKCRAPVVVGPARATREGEVRRVTAEVDGEPAWIESADCDLLPAPEAFASAFLLPALHRGAPLEVAGPLDPAWLANVEQLMWIWQDWWEYPVLLPRAPGAPEPAPAGRRVNGEDALAGRGPTAPAPSAAPGSGPAVRPGVALFFSGGVDSFYSLLRCGAGPDRLVAVQGFDVALGDEPRMTALEGSLREVARARGLKAVVAHTNIRDHHLMRKAPWGRTHGGGMAAVGHALGDGVTEALISSSVALNRRHKWGSHWATDPLFGSGRLALRELGMEVKRLDKLRTLTDEPLVRRHLRVCWENRSAAGNCSHCGKCVMTRLVLHDCGVLDEFPVFEGTATLARDLDAYPVNTGFLNQLEALAASPRLDPEVLRATRDLLKRSRHAQRWDVKHRRALLKTLLRWTGRAPS